MKKSVFALTLMIMSVFNGFGQATIKPSLGISFNNFSETSSGDFKGQVGAQFGASVAFGKKFYVEPGVYYTGKSSEFSYSMGPTEITDDILIKGIRVPVAVGVGVLGSEKTFASLRAFGGASGFFVTGVGDDIDKDNVSTPTWGVFAGAGVDFWIMFAELSYEWSVTDAAVEKSNIEIGKSRTLFFTVGLRF